MEATGRRVSPRALNTDTAGATRVTRALLACGVGSAPLFYVLAIVQIFTRPGFDIRRHAISLLTLGDLGWVQVANFAITGALAILCAIGLRRRLRHGRGGSWAPALIATYGLGMLTGAIFHPDPGLGFPPGTADTMPTTMSAHATVHMLGFFLAFVGVIAASFVISRRFAATGQRRWVAYCVATGIATPILIVLGSSIRDWVGVIFAVAGVVAFGWVSAVATQLIRELREV